MNETWICDSCDGTFQVTGRLPDAPGFWHARRDGRVVRLEVVRLTLDAGPGEVHDLGLFVRTGRTSFVTLSEFDAQWLERR